MSYLSLSNLFFLLLVLGGAGEVHQVRLQPGPDPNGGGQGVAARPTLPHEDCARRQAGGFPEKILDVPRVLAAPGHHYYGGSGYCYNSRKKIGEKKQSNEILDSFS